MLPTFALTGDGASGLLVHNAHRMAVSALPTTVKLGAKTTRVRPVSLRLEAFVDQVRATPPAAVDWYTKAALSIARMYKNDQLGCCVIAGKAHALGVWSANDPDSGPVVLASDDEIVSQYQGVCGHGDNGCYIPDVLDYFVNTGFLAGGKRYKIKGYASFDWTSKELTQTAVDLGGAITIGFNIPNAWMNTAVWDVTNSRIVGGHDVSPCGYGPNVIGTNADGVVVASWGRLYLFTWNAWLSRQYITEAYFMVPEFLWTGADGKAPSGVDLAGLLAAMNTIKGGGIPPLPDPVPVDPPAPVPPPAPKVLTGSTAPTRVSTWYGHVDIPALPVTVSETSAVGPKRAEPAKALAWANLLEDLRKLIADSVNPIEDIKKLLTDLGINL